MVLLVAAAIIAGGVYYHQSNRQHYRNEVERQLLAVVELKASQLLQWRKERLGDGNVLFKNTAFVGLVRRFFKSPEDVDARQQLSSWMERMSHHYRYDRIRLLDTQRVSRLSVPESQQPCPLAVCRQVSEVLRSGQVTLQDVFLNEHDQKAYLTVMVPVLDEQNNDQPLGVVVLRIDPSAYLYPFIGRWPTHSLTAETELIHREGNEAVILNDLRFQMNTALRRRISLDHVASPVVSAAMGREGVVEGTDYRGMPVLAALHGVLGTTWSLVAKMDMTEVEAPTRHQALEVVVIVACLLLCLATAVGLELRRQAADYYQARCEVEEARSKLGAVVESSADAIISADVDGTIRSWNEGARHGLGYSAAEAVGKPIVILYPPECSGEHERVVEKIKHGEVVTHHESEWANKNGRRYWVNLTVSGLKDEAGAIVGYSVIGRDITNQKRAEDEIRRLNYELRRDAAELEQRVEERTAELRAVNEELDAFAYAVCHDLRAPLRAMSGFSQALKEDYGATLQGGAIEFLNEINQASVKMGGLIDGLLQLSRSTRGELHRDTVDLSAAASRILDGLALAEPNRRVAWTVEPELTTRGDERMIEAVLANLLGNAWKYTAKTPQARIEFGCEDHAETSHRKTFFVRDNGAGFDMKHAARLFKPFQRLHRQDEFTGIGIGLATVQRIILRHGGRIEATSEPGKGAKFSFSLSSRGDNN